jgi:hypothetical protein
MLTSSECHIKFRDHAVHIRVDEHGRINCFKYNSQCCEWEQFESGCEYEAADFIFKDINMFRYVVSWHTETRQSS